MPPSPPRRLNLLDGMILMAGFAAGFHITLVYGSLSYPQFAALLRRYNGVRLSLGPGAFSSVPLPRLLPICWTVAEVTKVATFWLATYSPIVLWLRLQEPRPAGRRLFLQPGTVATLTATMVSAAGVILWVVASAVAGELSGLFLFRLAFTRFLANAGLAIALVWSCQALAGLWRAERGPVDRAGRLLGIGWITAFLLLAWSDFEGRIVAGSTLKQPGYDVYHLSELFEGLDR